MKRKAPGQVSSGLISSRACGPAGCGLTASRAPSSRPPGASCACLMSHFGLSSTRTMRLSVHVRRPSPSARFRTGQCVLQPASYVVHRGCRAGAGHRAQGGRLCMASQIIHCLRHTRPARGRLLASRAQAAGRAAAAACSTSGAGNRTGEGEGLAAERPGTPRGKAAAQQGELREQHHKGWHSSTRYRGPAWTGRGPRRRCVAAAVNVCTAPRKCRTAWPRGSKGQAMSRVAVAKKRNKTGTFCTGSGKSGKPVMEYALSSPLSSSRGSWGQRLSARSCRAAPERGAVRQMSCMGCSRARVERAPDPAAERWGTGYGVLGAPERAAVLASAHRPDTKPSQRKEGQPNADQVQRGPQRGGTGAGAPKLSTKRTDCDTHSRKRALRETLT